MTKGAALLAKAHSTQLGVPVVYRRGDTSATIMATLGQTVRETQDQDGMISETVTRDFVFPAASLAFLGASAEPKKGDKITHVAGGVTFTYDVRPGPTEQCYRRCDHEGVVIRVFTNQIARSA
jgi:hypothetical protein